MRYAVVVHETGLLEGDRHAYFTTYRDAVAACDLLNGLLFRSGKVAWIEVAEEETA